MSESTQTVEYRVTLSPEVATLLRENNVDLFEALNRDRDLAGQIQRGTSSSWKEPDSSSGQARMDPLTITASAVLVTAIGGAIERILRVLTRRPAIVATSTRQVQMDAAGRPMKKDNGEFVYAETVSQNFVEAKESNPLQFSAGITPGIRLSVGLEDAPGATDPARK